MTTYRFAMESWAHPPGHVGPGIEQHLLIAIGTAMLMARRLPERAVLALVVAAMLAGWAMRTALTLMWISRHTLSVSKRGITVDGKLRP